MLKKYVFIVITQLAFISGCVAKGKQTTMESETALYYVIRKSNDTLRKSPVLILLHGHGSHENDLSGLAHSIPDDWNVVSVRGPYQLSENSYRWYEVKMENGKIRIHIEQEEESRKKLLQLITEITRKYNVDNTKMIVAGFSQGANMAQSLGLSEPNVVAGFGVFSGRYVEEFTPYISNSINLKKTKAFISHGTSDNMLPTTYAVENVKKLKELGIQITYSEDTNGHSISSKQFEEFVKWLKIL